MKKKTAAEKAPKPATDVERLIDASLAERVRLAQAVADLVKVSRNLLDRLEREGSGKKETWAAIDGARQILSHYGVA